MWANYYYAFSQHFIDVSKLISNEISTPWIGSCVPRAYIIKPKLPDSHSVNIL